MSVTTDTITSFAICGVPMSASQFDPYESTTEAKRAVGFKFEDAQGNVYRWASFGAAVNRGLVVSADLSESSVVDSDNIVIAPASTQNSGDNAVGSRYVELTLADTGANEYAGGMLTITDDTGEGYTYPIVGNTGSGDPTGANIRLELKYPLQAALSATSDIAITGSLYKNVEGATTTDFAVAGVSLATQAQNDYGWIQTKGIVGILTEGATVAGKGIKVGATAGSVTEATATNDNVFGYCIAAGDTTGHCVAKINCE